MIQKAVRERRQGHAGQSNRHILRKVLQLLLDAFVLTCDAVSPRETHDLGDGSVQDGDLMPQPLVQSFFRRINGKPVP